MINVISAKLWMNPPQDTEYRVLIFDPQLDTWQVNAFESNLDALLFATALALETPASTTSRLTSPLSHQLLQRILQALP